MHWQLEAQRAAQDLDACLAAERSRWETGGYSGSFTAFRTSIEAAFEIADKAFERLTIRPGAASTMFQLRATLRARKRDLIAGLQAAWDKAQDAKREIDDEFGDIFA
ncbi:hypothetical protein T8K17_13395 [Thalassobaculum sp. OXR-137]|uniref:hypothetical protein n=1 Tax=Thalassobaculum sp. OXR-137 TaxID=3100173 RepID=UPI002AC94E8D|nr:hypothetical protein [Thalassobaculum sp. OXR-137]WPZ32237.1 hypothetical protein T8K17_13395 [Thalassobaculum sp. OXR-137]